MKSLLRTSAVAVVLIAVCILFAACIPTDEAKLQANELLLCFSSGDYEGASLYMHPSYVISADLMHSTVEEYLKLGADLSAGIDDVSFNSIQSSYYDRTVDGKHLVLGGVVTLSDGTKFDVSFEFIDNDSGYGISRFSASSFR